VGVKRADVTETGDKSGEPEDVSKLRLREGFWL